MTAARTVIKENLDRGLGSAPACTNDSEGEGHRETVRGVDRSMLLPETVEREQSKGPTTGLQEFQFRGGQQCPSAGCKSLATNASASAQFSHRLICWNNLLELHFGLEDGFLNLEAI